jgi:hypothetical protein
MPWHKSDAKKGYFFAFRPGLNRNILVYVRGLYPGVYGMCVFIFHPKLYAMHLIPEIILNVHMIHKSA